MVLYPKIRVMNRELKGITSEKKNKSMRILPFNKPYESMNHSHPKNGQNSKKKTPYNSLCPLLGWFSKVVGDLQLDLGNQRVSNWITWTNGWAARLNPPKPQKAVVVLSILTPIEGAGQAPVKRMNSGMSGFGKHTVNPSLTAVPVRNKIMAFFLGGGKKNPARVFAMIWTGLVDPLLSDQKTQSQMQKSTCRSYECKNPHLFFWKHIPLRQRASHFNDLGTFSESLMSLLNGNRGVHLYSKPLSWLEQGRGLE